MTAPVPDPDRPPGEPPEDVPTDTPAAEAAIVTAIAAGLAALLAVRVADSPQRVALLLASTAGRVIVEALMSAGVPTVVAEAVLASTLRTNPVPRTSRVAPPRDRVRRSTQGLNTVRRAQYLVKASRRVAEDYRRRLEDARRAQQATDELAARRKALAEALAAERRYWRLHVAAQRERDTAARRLDDAAKAHGPWLGWYSRHDARTSKACAEADGRNFRADRRPAIGFPGLAYHGGCRCRPGPPHRTDRDVYDIVPDEH